MTTKQIQEQMEKALDAKLKEAYSPTPTKSKSNTITIKTDKNKTAKAKSRTTIGTIPPNRIITPKKDKPPRYKPNYMHESAEGEEGGGENISDLQIKKVDNDTYQVYKDGKPTRQVSFLLDGEDAIELDDKPFEPGEKEDILQAYARPTHPLTSDIGESAPGEPVKPYVKPDHPLQSDLGDEGDDTADTGEGDEGGGEDEGGGVEEDCVRLSNRGGGFDEDKEVEACESLEMWAKHAALREDNIDDKLDANLQTEKTDEDSVNESYPITTKSPTVAHNNLTHNGYKYVKSTTHTGEPATRETKPEVNGSVNHHYQKGNQKATVKHGHESTLVHMHEVNIKSNKKQKKASKSKMKPKSEMWGLESRD